MEDKIYSLKKYYDRSPQRLKKILGGIYRTIPLSLRYGKVYRYYRDLLKESGSWDREKIREYQTLRLRRLVRHAYDNVPYYREVFDNLKLKPDDIKEIEDLPKLPLLTKQAVKANRENLVARNYPASRLLYQTTGGSTGSPLIFYHEKGTGRSKETAFFESLWSRLGYRWWKDRLVSLRGEMVKANRGFWEYEPIRNNLVMSVYNMNDDTLPVYIDVIREFQPRFFYAYPSAITVLAGYMKRKRLEPFPSLKGILCGSEHLFGTQRRLLEEVFGCPILAWYGMGEKVVLAGTCERTSDYHIFPEYGITELLDDNGSPAAKDGQECEIIGTVFDNDIMPFIRYRTEDRGVLTTRNCVCGRKYAMLSGITGRIQEAIVSRDGALVPLNGLMVSLDSGVFSRSDKGWDKIRHFQFIQDEKGKLVLKVETSSSGENRELLSYLEGMFSPRISPVCDLKIELVKEIKKTVRGKHVFLVQNLDVKEFSRSGA